MSSPIFNVRDVSFGMEGPVVRSKSICRNADMASFGNAAYKDWARLIDPSQYCLTYAVSLSSIHIAITQLSVETSLVRRLDNLVTRKLATMRTQPFTFWLCFEIDTTPVKPLVWTVIVIAGDHIAK